MALLLQPLPHSQQLRARLQVDSGLFPLLREGNARRSLSEARTTVLPEMETGQLCTESFNEPHAISQLRI